jgi:hypothetical protein
LVVHGANELFWAVFEIVFRPPGFASHFAVPKPRFSVELACAAPIFISQPALGTVSIDTFETDPREWFTIVPFHFGRHTTGATPTH